MTGVETTQIIVAGTALLIQQLPNAIEAAIRIKRLLEEMGAEVDLRAINQQALDAALATESKIAEFHRKYPPLAEDED